MNNELRHPLTDLTTGSVLRVCDGQGRAVVVFEGRVWITQTGDRRDIVLDAGESFRVDRPGLTLVQALRDSKLMLLDGGPMPLPASSYGLHQWARAQRSAAIGDAMVIGWAALCSAVVNAFTPASRPATPRPLALRAAGR